MISFKSCASPRTRPQRADVVSILYARAEVAVPDGRDAATRTALPANFIGDTLLQVCPRCPADARPDRPGRTSR